MVVWVRFSKEDTGIKMKWECKKWHCKMNVMNLWRCEDAEGDKYN